MERIVNQEQLNLIESNYSFSYVLKNQGPIYLNNYIKFELIIYYFKLNRNMIINHHNEFKDILPLLDDSKYLITKSYIVCNDKYYSLDYLFNVIKSIKEISSSELSPISFPSPFKEENDTKTFNPSLKSNTINFPSKQVPLNSKRESFALRLVANNECQNYPHDVKSIYKLRMEKLLLSLLNNQLPTSESSINELKILISYLKLYSLKSFINKITPEYFNIPINEIGIRLMNYEEAEVQATQLKLQSLSKTKENLQEQYYHFASSEYIPKSHLVRLNKRIRELKLQELQQSFDLYFQTHNSEVFNHNFLQNILLSLEAGYVDFNYYYFNPVIRLFQMDNQHASFYAELHLDTLLNLFDDESFIKSYSSKKLSRSQDNH